MKQDILVPFDGSANATKALLVAIDMAKAFNEKIVLLNVQWSYETPHTFSQSQIDDYLIQMGDEAMQPGKDILEQTGVGFITKMLVGDPREQICKEAQEGSAEGAACKDHGMRMIVMGSRGLNAFIGSLLGSVSMEILHNAPCPVMIVPSSG